MAKYDPLSQWLGNVSEREVAVSFQEIEAILGFTLPASARAWVSWWENESAPSRSQCKAWALAGFRTEHLDLVNQTVVFAKSPRLKLLATVLPMSKEKAGDPAAPLA